MAHADLLGRGHPFRQWKSWTIPGDQLERARRIGHTVWSELRPIVEANPATTFVLTHFSLRHSDPEIVAFFDKQGLDNVVAWAHPASRLPESYQ